MDWSEQEFKSLCLGDQRLNARLKKVADRLYKSPMASINQSCDSWKDTKAAYRLFDNEKLEYQKIFEAHRDATSVRLKPLDTVLAIQDTTFFNYHNHQKKEGLGLIHSNQRPIQGLLAHNTLLTTLSGLPLGLFDQKLYARKNRIGKAKKHEPAIEKKESYRWIEALDQLKSHLPEHIHCIVVADREADISELIEGCLDRGFDFVLRSQLDRILGEKKKRWESTKNDRLIEYLKNSAVQGVAQVQVTDQKKRTKRSATVEIKFSSLEIPLPWRMEWSHKEQTLLDLYVVEVKEPHPPEGYEPVYWRLLTSIEVEEMKQALEVIEIYKKRWVIETFHKVIKSGWNVEDCRLETFKRIRRYIALISVVAWRLHWITEMAKLYPDVSCEVAFEKREWVPIYRFSKKNALLPEAPPGLQETVKNLAQLGGFLNRKSDKDPGITTVWRGWKVLQSHLLLTYG